jgi:hypothetical protein
MRCLRKRGKFWHDAGADWVGERELTTGLLSKSASFRLIVSGEFGVKEIELLIRKPPIN